MKLERFFCVMALVVSLQGAIVYGQKAKGIKTVDQVNLALGKPCAQSSRSQWSNSEQGAVDGVKNGSFGFHTGPGPAWWQVDLGAMYALDQVVIFNRTDCCAERARTIQVLLSDNGADFRTIYTHNGSVFGGVMNNNALKVPVNGAAGRYVRLQITSNEHFHLDEVEVYGEPSAVHTVSTVRWVPYEGTIPANAVVGGTENGQPLFVGRMPFQGGVHPGKVLPGGFCNIGWGGKEYSINSGFEVLTAAPNTVAWVEYRGSVPANAIPGGQNDAGGRQPLYIAKHAYQGGEHCGKLWANACNIGWGGQEIVLNEKIYILVSGKTEGAKVIIEEKSGDVAVDQSESATKLKLPKEVKMMIGMMGVPQDETDLALTVLGTAARIASTYQNQSSDFLTGKKQELQALLQQVITLKNGNINRVPFFQDLIANSERDLNTLLKTATKSGAATEDGNSKTATIIIPQSDWNASGYSSKGQLGAYTSWADKWQLPTAGKAAVLFKASARNDIHIAFADAAKTMDPMYEIVIGGWDNTKCAIRRRSQGSPIHETAGAIRKPGLAADYWAMVDKDKGVIAAGYGNVVGQNVIIETRDANFLGNVRFFALSSWNTPIEYTDVRTADLAEEKPTGVYVRAMKPVYRKDDKIIVEYNDFPVTSGAWVNIVQKGNRDDDWGTYQYTKGKSGKLEFEFTWGLEPGDYEVRGYFSSSDYTVKARYAFKVVE